jgi:hypothetical protein
MTVAYMQIRIWSIGGFFGVRAAAWAALNVPARLGDA